MRHLGSLEDEQLALRFHDYMLVRGVSTTVESEGSEWALWVVDEDHVESAREELEAFLESPNDWKFVKASAAAKHLRSDEESRERKLEKRQRRLSRSLPGSRQPFVTSTLIALSVGLTILASNFRDGLRLSNRHSVVRWLSIEDFERDGDMIRWRRGMPSLRNGEVWRLVTPIFLHGGFLHLIFNMLWLRQLGTAVEFRKGHWWMIGLVLLTAAGSNMLQFTAGGSPNFLGMSGVVFGLFGYIWMKGKYHPEDGLFMPPNLVFFMLFWFALCFTGAVGPIANWAHAGGLAIGALLGWLPVRRRR